MDQTFMVRHWKGEDSIERVVAEKLLLADNVIEALLRCVPINDVENWRLDSHVWQYASLTNPQAQLEEADYWEAELIEDPLEFLPSYQSAVLN